MKSPAGTKPALTMMSGGCETNVFIFSSIEMTIAIRPPDVLQISSKRGEERRRRWLCFISDVRSRLEMLSRRRCHSSVSPSALQNWLKWRTTWRLSERGTRRSLSSDLSRMRFCFRSEPRSRKSNAIVKHEHMM